MYRPLSEIWERNETRIRGEKCELIFWFHDEELYPLLCLRQVHEDSNISYINMSNVRLRLVIAKEHPQISYSQIPEEEEVPYSSPIADFEDTQKAVSPLEFKP